MTKVALVACKEYKQDAVRQAVDRGLQLLGGAGRFVRPGQKVLLKPNLLFGDPPEKCTNTHPEVFRAVASAFRDAGAHVVYGDHPGYGTPASAAKRAGLYDAAEELGIEMADFRAATDVPVEGNELLESVPIAKGVFESDVIVSLPKLKTHGFEKFTGCVKNQFGCIPGLTKAAFHVRFPDANVFARMLLTVNKIVSPSLYIMDGIIGMEGNGPRGGTPLNMGVLLFSDDPIALDATVCRLIDLDPQYVPTIKYGAEGGVGVWREEEIAIVGDDPKSFYAPSFHVDRAPIRPYRSSGALRLAANMLVPKPTIDEEKCIRCGICVEACPADPKALNWRSGSRQDSRPTRQDSRATKQEPPRYTYQNCIRCYCCQEMCPESAIFLRKTLVRRFMDLFTGNR